MPFREGASARNRRDRIGGMENNVNETLLFVLERIKSLETHQDQDAVLLLQLNTAIQGHPLGAQVAQWRDNSSAIVAKRHAPGSQQRLDEVIQRMKEN